MRHILLRNLLLASTICGIAAVTAAKHTLTPTITSTPVTTTRPASSPQLLAAIGQLGGQEYATREIGQKFLDTLPLTQRDTLADLLAAQKDPEVIARLQRRLDDMDEELAINPPPISLHLDNANAAAFSQALADQIQLPVRIRALPEKSFSINVDRKPFADLLVEINASFGTDPNSVLQPRLLSLPHIKTYQTYKGFATCSVSTLPLFAPMKFAQ